MMRIYSITIIIIIKIIIIIIIIIILLIIIELIKVPTGKKTHASIYLFIYYTYIFISF